ncbi:fasciclin domain family [Apiospora saccharicola]|uniref:Fasciclin domain family n=1 Tax=Apiospora saccharicola TaxID=335842 RepID=A0ABR1V9R7_9PEZI
MTPSLVNPRSLDPLALPDPPESPANLVLLVLPVHPARQVLPVLPVPLEDPPDGHGHHKSDLTLYEAIQASEYATKFAKLIDNYPDIVKTLNSTKKDESITIFVPTDRAFEKIPDGKPPPRAFVEKLLEYHVVPGYFPAGRVLVSSTMPTAFESKRHLGGRPQRIHVGVGYGGVRFNFYSKLVFANLYCKNGIAHGIDALLVPPPPGKKLIELFPQQFSSLILAAEKTKLGKDLKDKLGKRPNLTGGSTFFAPTNWAFQKLGPRANAFLFNTKRGRRYLRALLEYHVVANETLYTDAYYGRKAVSAADAWEDAVEAEARRGSSRYHVDLPSLLGDKSVAVDVWRWGGVVSMKVNGFTRVAVTDVPDRDGVIHVVGSVLIPPHGRHGVYDGESEVEVQELVERLLPYMKEDDDGDEEEGEEETYRNNGGIGEL